MDAKNCSSLSSSVSSKIQESKEIFERRYHIRALVILEEVCQCNFNVAVLHRIRPEFYIRKGDSVALRSLYLCKAMEAAQSITESKSGLDIDNPVKSDVWPSQKFLQPSISKLQDMLRDHIIHCNFLLSKHQACMIVDTEESSLLMLGKRKRSDIQGNKPLKESPGNLIATMQQGTFACDKETARFCPDDNLLIQMLIQKHHNSEYGPVQIHTFENLFTILPQDLYDYHPWKDRDWRVLYFFCRKPVAGDSPESVADDGQKPTAKDIKVHGEHTWKILPKHPKMVRNQKNQKIGRVTNYRFFSAGKSSSWFLHIYALDGSMAVLKEGTWVVCKISHMVLGQYLKIHPIRPKRSCIFLNEEEHKKRHL